MKASTLRDARACTRGFYFELTPRIPYYRLKLRRRWRWRVWAAITEVFTDE